MISTEKIVRPDAKGRIGIGAFIEEGLSGFRVSVDNHHRIVLEPLIEKPRHPKSRLKVRDLETFLQQCPRFTPEEADSFAADLDEIRKHQTPLRNPWES